MRRLTTIRSNKRRKWNLGVVIHTIKELDPKHLHSTWVKQNNNALWKAAVRYCGSWGDAIVAAGIDYDQVRLAGPSGAPPNKGTGGICKRPGCNKLHHARGWCKQCYTIEMRQEKLRLRLNNNNNNSNNDNDAVSKTTNRR